MMRISKKKTHESGIVMRTPTAASSTLTTALRLMTLEQAKARALKTGNMISLIDKGLKDAAFSWIH
jgi:hypothetical protein